jgi:hypothetical protein
MAWDWVGFRFAIGVLVGVLMAFSAEAPGVDELGSLRPNLPLETAGWRALGGDGDQHDVGRLELGFRSAATRGRGNQQKNEGHDDLHDGHTVVRIIDEVSDS